MGKVLSVVARPFRNFNVESRAHKVISMEKPMPAPKYKSDAEAYDRLVREYPDVLEESMKKHTQLDKNLKDIFVVSSDKNLNITLENPNRPLPSERKQVNNFELGFKESENVPIGKVALKDIFKFLGKHQADSKMYDAKKIADEYQVDEAKVSNILKYYHLYEVYIPPLKDVRAKFAAPSLPKPVKPAGKAIGEGRKVTVELIKSYRHKDDDKT